MGKATQILQMFEILIFIRSTNATNDKNTELSSYFRFWKLRYRKL